VPLQRSILFIRSGRSSRLYYVVNITEIVMMDLHSHWTSRNIEKKIKKKDSTSLFFNELEKLEVGWSLREFVNCACQVKMNMSSSYTLISKE
jgi:ribosome-associated toxin RatA of RatAB toxin-antitoxin module